MLSDCCVFIVPQQTKFTVFICMVSNHCSEVVALFVCLRCEWIYHTHTASSCTEISFLYSALISCLNTSAEASASETVTFQTAVIFAHRARATVWKQSLKHGSSCLCLWRNTNSEWSCLVKVTTRWFDLDQMKLPAGINSNIRNNIFVSV